MAEQSVKERVGRVKLESVRPSWSEIAAIVEEGPTHFNGYGGRSQWSAAEQMAVALAPERFPVAIRVELAGLANRLPEVEVLLAQDIEFAVRRRLAGEVGELTATAETLLAKDDDVRVTRAIARAKFLGDLAQSAIAHRHERIAMLSMLHNVENIDDDVLSELAIGLVAGTMDWDSGIAVGVVRCATDLLQEKESLSHKVELLKEQLDKRGASTDAESWETEVIRTQWQEEDEWEDIVYRILEERENGDSETELD